MLDFFSFDDFDSESVVVLETLFSGPVIFSVDFSMDFSEDFSFDNFNLSVFASSFVADFLDGDFSESSEGFLDFSAEVFSESDRLFSVFSMDLEIGFDALSVVFSDILSDFSDCDFTGVDEIGLFDSSGFELFKIDFIVGLGFDDITSTLSFTTVFDSDFFGELVLSVLSVFSDLSEVLSDFLSASDFGFVPASDFSSGFDFSFLSDSLSDVLVFVGSGIGS